MKFCAIVVIAAVCGCAKTPPPGPDTGGTDKKQETTNSMGYGAEVIADTPKGAEPGMLYMNVYAKMYKHHFPNGYVDQDTFWGRVYKVLSPGERAILLANELFGEFHNGGFEQYFSNGNYEHAHETVRLLRRVGDNRAADFLQKAVQIARIPDPLPPGYEYEGSDEIGAALEKLEKENRPADYKARPLSGMEAALDDYIRQHPEEFK